MNPELGSTEPLPASRERQRPLKWIAINSHKRAQSEL
jgi:hypothetical protein